MSLSLTLVAALLLGQLTEPTPDPSPLQLPMAEAEPATATPPAGDYFERAQPPALRPETASPQAAPTFAPPEENAFSRVRPTSGEETNDGRYRSAPAGGPATPPGGWSGSEGGFTPAPDRAASGRARISARSNGNTASLAPLAEGEMELSRKLLVELARIPAAEQSDGEKLKLVDALRRSSNSQATVDAYWRLVTATADYNAAMQDAELVAGWRPPANRSDPVIDLAYDDALARRAEARADWLAARHDLQRTASSISSSGKLPLTADLPHSGAYVLNFDKIFTSTAAAPRAAARGRDLIPARYEGVRKRAETLQGAENRLSQLESAYQRGQANSAAVTEMLDKTRVARAAFLRSVYIYNQEIANYAFAVPGVTNHETLASILIKHIPKAGDPRSVLQSAESASPEVSSEAIPATFVEPSSSLVPQAAPAELQPEPEAADRIPLTAPKLIPQPSFVPPTPAAAAPAPFYPPPRGTDVPTLAEPQPTPAE